MFTSAKPNWHGIDLQCRQVFRVWTPTSTFSEILQLRCDKNPYKKYYLFSLNTCEKKKASDQITEPWTWLVSPLQVHLSPSMLGILGAPERPGYKLRTYGSAATGNRSLIPPPAKSPSAPPAQHNTTEHTVKAGLTGMPHDGGRRRPHFHSAAAIVWIRNELNDTFRCFSVFVNCILLMFHIASLLFKLVVCSASVWDGAEERGKRVSAGLIWY